MGPMKTLTPISYPSKAPSKPWAASQRSSKEMNVKFKLDGKIFRSLITFVALLSSSRAWEMKERKHIRFSNRKQTAHVRALCELILRNYRRVNAKQNKYDTKLQINMKYAIFIIYL